jgi:hypothetical protein
MKKALLLSVSLVLANTAFAQKIVCQRSGIEVTLAELNKGSDAVVNSLLTCEEELFIGEVCFEGTASKAAKMLRLIDATIFEPAGEFYMTVEKLEKRAKTVKYTITDGPNEEVVTEAEIKKCSAQ